MIIVKGTPPAELLDGSVESVMVKGEPVKVDDILAFKQGRGVREDRQYVKVRGRGNCWLEISR